jgi:hypothetical protein
MTKCKTHYRKVFKSDHLGVADLEDLQESGSNLVFTIDHVNQEIGARVAGKKGNFNIAYFKENIKPWVLNAGNSKTMRGFANGSSFVEDWGGITVQLYIDKSASFGGNVTGGVRIHPSQPKQRQELKQNMKAPWSNAISAYKRDGHLGAVLERMDISQQNQNLIIQQAGQ